MKSPKKGAAILVGGGDGRIEKAYDTACTLLHLMNATTIFPAVCSHDTDHRPAAKDVDALKGVDNIVKLLNRQK